MMAVKVRFGHRTEAVVERKLSSSYAPEEEGCWVGAMFGLVWLTRKNVAVQGRTGVEAAVTRAIYVWLIVAGVPLHWED